MACIALDGKLYPLDQALDEHPNGRCALVPDVLDYADLGLDIPREAPPQNARDWLSGQPAEAQRRVLGGTRFDAWKAGEIELNQLAVVRPNSIWGDTAVIRPLNDIPTRSGTPIQQISAPLEIPELKKVIHAPSRFQGPINDLAKMEDATDELSRVSNLEILNATPEGEELGVAISNWVGGANEQHRRGAVKWLKNSDDFTGWREVNGAKISEAVSISPPVNVPTHRGFTIWDKSVDQVEDIYTVGTKFDSGISSFSVDENLARGFAGRGSVLSDQTSVILHLEPGAKGLNISSISEGILEKERIFQGRFEVVRVERQFVRKAGYDEPGTILNVDIRQIANFVKEAK